jgi:hypothetical protein
VLEARVQERGGTAVEETLADRAARVQRAQELNQQRDAFHRSHQGVQAAREACGRLVNDLKSNPELLRRIGCRIHDVYGGVTMLVGQGVVLTVQAHFPYVNSLENTALVAQFYDGVPPLPKLITFSEEEPRTLAKWKFTFGLLGPDRTGWVGPDRKEHAPEALAEFLLRHFMDLQQRQLR